MTEPFKQGAAVEQCCLISSSTLISTDGSKSTRSFGVVFVNELVG
jgi:hypothetical protein